MRPNLKTWNGNNINDGTNYSALFPVGAFFPQPGVGIQEVNRTDTYPAFAQKLWQSRQMPITIIPLGTFASQLETLNKWFDVHDKILHQLVITDALTSQDWYVYATVEKQVRAVPGDVTFLLRVLDPIWRKVTASQDTWSVTASGQTRTITPGGNRFAKPKITIKPTSGKSSGLLYRRWRGWRNPTTRALTNYPLDVANAALDTATLISGGKLQADGDDLRVYDNGVEIPRWLSNLNTANSKVWVELDFDPRVQLTVSGAIASSGAVATINFKRTSANRRALKDLAKKTTMLLIIDSEVFTFADVDVDGYKVTGCVRARRSSSMAAHSDGVTAYWIQHDLWICYGNTSLTAPEQSDEEQPILDLPNSTNTSWAYLLFRERDNLRTGAWRAHINRRLGNQSNFYTGDSGAWANPATELGVAIKAWESAGIWRSDTAEIVWTIYNPAGFTTVTMNGDKYRYAAGWPSLAGLQKSADGVTWETVFNEATPGSLQTWTAWSRSSVSLSGTYQYLRFIISGSLAASANNAVYIDAAAATLVVSSSNVPQLGFSGAEQSQYEIDVSLTNNTLGESLVFKGTLQTNDELIIDCDARKVYIKDDPGHSLLSGLFLPKRAEWLRLQAGTNQLQYDESGAVGVTVTTDYSERML